MIRTYALAGLLVLGAASAHADLLELSGFGGYTTLGMKQVNSMLASPKAVPGLDQTTTTDINNGWLAGLDLRTGALIPIPFVSLGLKAEYIGANTGEAAGTSGGLPYEVKEDPSLLAGLLGLDFSIGIPATPLKVGVSAYGGYGEGLIQQSVAAGSNVPVVPELYRGGGFVGELEGRLDWKLVSVLHLYGFGGWRSASFGTFSDPAGNKFNFGVNGAAAPEVDFSGATGGAGLTLDF